MSLSNLHPMVFNGSGEQQGAFADLPYIALDRLMPMHLIIDDKGKVMHVGPTLAKIAPVDLEGMSFNELTEVLQPRGVQDLAAMRAADGGQLRVSLQGNEDLMLKGICVPLADTGALINLSFGYAVTTAVEHFHLTCGDFANTDLTIEMLYLIEAKSAAQEEQRKLNMRLHGAKEKAEAAALSDGLTGLANRRAFDLALARCIENGSPFSIMHVDLDFFKAVNDTMGHAAGDAVLAKVAEVLQAETRASDLVARVGGDEFTILFVRFTDPDRLMTAAKRIIARLEEPVPFGSETCNISGSVGITVTTERGEDDEEAAKRIMHEADVALYASKFRGRRQATLYHPGLDEEVAALAAASEPSPR